MKPFHYLLFISPQCSGHMRREKKEVMKRLQLRKTRGNETVTSPVMSEIESSETVTADYTTIYVPMAPIRVGIPQFNHHEREKQMAEMQSIVTIPFTWPMHVFSSTAKPGRYNKFHATYSKLMSYAPATSVKNTKRKWHGLLVIP